MLSDENRKAFGRFYDTVRGTPHLDARTVTLVGLAAAMARECTP